MYNDFFHKVVSIADDDPPSEEFSRRVISAVRETYEVIESSQELKMLSKFYELSCKGIASTNDEAIKTIFQEIGALCVEYGYRPRKSAQQSVQADDCPSCAGSGKKEIGGMLLTCLACDGTGNRR